MGPEREKQVNFSFKDILLNNDLGPGAIYFIGLEIITLALLLQDPGNIKTNQYSVTSGINC